MKVYKRTNLFRLNGFKSKVYIIANGTLYEDGNKKIAIFRNRKWKFLENRIYPLKRHGRMLTYILRNLREKDNYTNTDKILKGISVREILLENNECIS